MKRRMPTTNHKSKGAPRWMVTFSDLMTLILVFFILLFSMSQIDVIKFRAVAESFNNRVIFDFYPSVVPLDNPSLKSDDLDVKSGEDEFPDPTDKKNFDQAPADQGPENGEVADKEDDLQELLAEIQTYLTDNQLEEVISAYRNNRGVVLILQEKVLFESGQAILLPEAKPFLSKVANMVATMPNPVKVEGHTDNRAIDTYRYPSNWELSGARASSVIRYLIEEHSLTPSRFTAIGYGETRPIVPNTNEINWQKNRRVEVVITDPSYNENEPIKQ